MQLSQKVLKTFSFEILNDFEEGLHNVLAQGIQRDWSKWKNLISKGILSKAVIIAEKNNRTQDFTNYNEFAKNIDFADPIEIISGLSSAGNQFFSNFFNSPKEKGTLQQSIGEINRFRNLIYHPGGKSIYLSDIKVFLRSGITIVSILKLSSLKLKFEEIIKDIEQYLANHSHLLKESLEDIHHNLPQPDYNEWHGLVGRDDIKEKIIQDFNKGYNRVIAITGGGGIGKSALALNISLEYTNPLNYSFRHIIWITSKNNFLDYSGIAYLKPDYFYNNNYKDFLNQFLSGFYNSLYCTNLDLITEEKLEADINEIFENYTRILCVVDNLENIDDPKILDFIKNKILPPNYVLITSRKGLGEINKTYKLEPLEDSYALKLFENLCTYYNIDIKKINTRKLKELLKKTNNYPLVIKWCLSLVANKKMELEAAFSELNKPQNDLLEFIFQKLYSQLSKTSKRILRALALYKEIPDRNIIAYIANLESEDELTDAIFELEQHSLISQERIDSKEGIIETIILLGLAQTFLNNIINGDKSSKTKVEKRILDIEEELDFASSDLNNDFRPAQKLAQSKLLKALRLVNESTANVKVATNLINEAERLVPNFYLVPYFKALIELKKYDYEYAVVKQLLEQSISINPEDPSVIIEYARVLKKHKKESYKQYARMFHKAFELAKKTGYGLEAASAYFFAGNYNLAFEVVQALKNLETDFPRGSSQKYLFCQIYLSYIELNIHINMQHICLEQLLECELNIEELYKEKTKNYRLLAGKYYAIVALLYSMANDMDNTAKYLKLSNKVLQTYKSVDKHLITIKEMICYNHLTEIITTKNPYVKRDRIRKIDTECNGKDRKILLNKFQKIIAKINKEIRF